MKITPDKIESLKPGQVFVFGSNEAGIHGAGAAALAADRFGAEWKYGFGHWGQSFAIPTKDKQIRTLPLDRIAGYVKAFLQYAKESPRMEFLVTQIGCGLAGLTPEQVAPLFFANEIPSNVSLPAEFWAAQKSQQNNK